METSDYVRHVRRRPPTRLIPPLTTEQAEYFWPRVEKGEPDACWPWKAGKTPQGYGEVVLWINGKRFKAFTHRVAYSLTTGPIPQGLEINHAHERGCNLRSCCNPNHLEPVTHAENQGRGFRARQTHCQYDHPLNEKRRCPICAKRLITEYRQRQLDALAKGITKPVPTACYHGHPMNNNPTNVHTNKYGDHFCKTCAALRIHKHRVLHSPKSPL